MTCRSGGGERPHGEGQLHQHDTFATLFDDDGASFVIHGGAHDMKTNPSSNSGSRLLCGVFERIKG